MPDTERFTTLWAVIYNGVEEFSISSNNDIDTIPIIIENEVPFLKIVINGKSYYFLIDTGSMMSVMFKDVASKVAAKQLLSDSTDKASKGTGIDGIFTGYPGVVDKLAISHNTILNNLPITIIPAAAIDINFLFWNLAHIDGIIGWDVLQHFDFTIDYKNLCLIIRKPQRKDNIVRNLFWDKSPIIKMYAGKGNFPIMFQFDSGASSSTFYNSSILQAIIDHSDTGNSDTFASKEETEYGLQTSIKTSRKIIPKLQLLNKTDSQWTRISITNCSMQDGESILGNMSGISGHLGSGYFLTKAVHMDILNGIFEIIE